MPTTPRDSQRPELSDPKSPSVDQGSVTMGSSCGSLTDRVAARRRSVLASNSRYPRMSADLPTSFATGANIVMTISLLPGPWSCERGVRCSSGSLAQRFGLHRSGSPFLARFDFSHLRLKTARLSALVSKVSPAAQMPEAEDVGSYAAERGAAVRIVLCGSVVVASTLLGGGLGVDSQPPQHPAR